MSHSLQREDNPTFPASDDAFEAAERRSPVVRLLEAARIPVHPGFIQAVMERLPTPAWSRGRSLGLVALAAAVVLAVAASVLLGVGEEGGGLAAVGGLVELISSGLLASAGFLAASWSGLRSSLGVALSDNPGTIAAVAVLLIGAVYSLGRLLGRRREAVAARRRVDHR